jgi:arylsulfatase A-like enzyme/Flp pilus assembly protein TadD
MDRLAARGVRFDDAHAHNVLTLPSHANILSGLLPTEHGVRDNAGFRFPAGPETLATLLKARGYATGAFVSAFPLAARFGLGRGFDVYDDHFVDGTARPAFLEQERSGTETVARARRWLESQEKRPYFCWVHLFEPHFPYEPKGTLGSRFRGERAYHGEVAAADAALAPLLDPILAAGRSGRSLVVLTADHGESLGEHGEATHGLFAYEATLRVPLVLHQEQLFAPRAVAEPARHVDVLPTVLDALALPIPDGLPGRSLLGLAAGERGEPVTTYFEAFSGTLNRGWAPVRGVLRDRTKYIDLPIPELYDLRADPAESRNLAASEPRRVEALRTLLSSFRPGDAATRPSREDAETRERLASLGYLGAGSGAAKDRYTEDDDPKRLIELDRELEEVVGLYRGGDLAAALRRCRELVSRRPTMLVSLLHLAHLEREAGELAAAVATLQDAVGLDPSNTTTVTLLGASLTQSGRTKEAVALLEPYAQRAEPDFELLLADSLALARLGRAKDALDRLRRARELEPGNALVLVNEGTVHLMAGNAAGARRAFEAALALSPESARAHGSLALLEAEAGRAPEALARFQEAVALDPRECERLPPLAAVLVRGRPQEEARSHLERLLTAVPAGQCAREVERALGLVRQLRGAG